MTADAFLAWATETGFRSELVAGEVVAMAPGRYAHAHLKGRAFRAPGNAVARAGPPCEAIVDGMAVRVDEDTLYQPDVILRCGARMAWDTVAVPDPLLLVEVISPSTAVLDTGGKLAGYFRVPSVRHYLILHAEARILIHHARARRTAPSPRASFAMARWRWTRPASCWMSPPSSANRSRRQAESVGPDAQRVRSGGRQHQRTPLRGSASIRSRCRRHEGHRAEQGRSAAPVSPSVASDPRPGAIPPSRGT